MGIRYVGLYQAVAVAKKGMQVVCSGYQVCGVYFGSMPQMGTYAYFLITVEYFYNILHVNST